MFFEFFLLLFKYSCLHFLPTTLPTFPPENFSKKILN